MELAPANQINMSRILRFPSAVRRDPAIGVWMREHSGELGAIARHWFEVMRGCGADVRELLHDGHPTACVGDAAFGYVNAFTAHVNVGFFPKRARVGAGSTRVEIHGIQRASVYAQGEQVRSRVVAGDIKSAARVVNVLVVDVGVENADIVS